MAMYWASLLSTLVGAAIGLAATFIAARMRWTRDKTDREARDRRQLYAEYLAAVATTRNRLRMAARTADEPLVERAEQARTAFAEGRAYELRYQVALIAPKEVADASTAVVRALRELRDAIEAGVLRGEPNYVTLRESFDDRYESLIRHMREDVGLDCCSPLWTRRTATFSVRTWHRTLPDSRSNCSCAR
jgi:hypothetical protein